MRGVDVLEIQKTNLNNTKYFHITGVKQDTTLVQKISIQFLIGQTPNIFFIACTFPYKTCYKCSKTEDDS